MRKMLLTSLIVCMVALLPTVYLPVVLARQPITLRCDVFIDFNYDWVGVGGSSPFTWIGAVWGDINGDFYISLVDASFPGKTEHFSETWIIETIDGGIAGYDIGVWTFANFKWGANGAVTSAAGDLSHLLGYNMRYSGTTTDPNVPFGVPINGTGTLILSSG